MTKVNGKAYIAWINTCIIWGTTYLAIRIGVESFPVMLFAGLRWILAGLILIAFLKYKNYKFPRGKDFVKIGIMGIMLIGFGNGFVVFSEQYIPSGLTAIIITTTPLWMVGIESFIPGQKKFNYLVWLGLILGIAGVALIFSGDLNSLFNPQYFLGIIGLLLAEISWAGGSVYSKHKKIDVHPLMSASLQMLVAGMLQTLLGTALGEFSGMHVSTNGLLAFLYLVMFGSLVGYTSYIYAISHLPISLVSTYAYINPIIALFLGWIVLNEKMTFVIFIASIIIIAGVILVKMGSDRLINNSRKIEEVTESI